MLRITLHTGGMNRFSQTSSASALTSRIRTERDVVATCVHLLGYWPKDSLVLMVTDSSGVGPLIRIDIADPFETPAEDYLDALFKSIPRQNGLNQSAQRIFVLMFGGRLSTCPDNSRAQPARPITESDQELFERAAYYLEPIQSSGSRHNLQVLDVIAVGQTVYWSVNPETGGLEPVGWVNDIFSSPVYAELVSRGSLVSSSSREAFSIKKWNPLDTHHPHTTELWLASAEAAAVRYVEMKQALNPLEPFQAEAELMLWDSVLEAVADSVYLEKENNIAPSTLGDRIRTTVPSDAAGYLVASLTNSATLHYLVYLACTDLSRTLAALGLLEGYIQFFLDDAGQSSRRLLPTAETLSAFDLEKISPILNVQGVREPADSSEAGSHFAGVLSGALQTPPHWRRLEALERLCALFENVARHKCESMLIASQAWVKWLRGNSTEASYLLESADQKYLESSPLLLKSLLGSSAIPMWLTQPGGAPPVR